MGYSEFYSKCKELYNKYGSMSFTISGETQTLKHFFDVYCDDCEIEDPFKQFVSCVEDAIENGVDDSNELEFITTAFLDFLEVTTFDFYNNDEIVTIEFNGEVVLSNPIKELYPQDYN